MMSAFLNKYSYKIIGLLLFVVVWLVLSIIVADENFIFPGPFITFLKTIEVLKDSYIYKCIFQTLLRMFVGFSISLVLAFIFGSISGINAKIEDIISPSMTIIRAVPTATLVYLFLVMVGAKITPVLIVILVSFPILYESVLGGIKSTPRELLESSKLDASSDFNTLFKIRIPLAKPYIIVGIVSSFALSLKIEIMAEVITGYTRSGVGSAILAAFRTDPTNMVLPFSYSLIAIVIILIFDFIGNYIKNN